MGFIGDFAISLEMHWILLKRNAINANVLRVALYLTPIGKHTANNETRRVCYQVNDALISISFRNVSNHLKNLLTQQKETNKIVT